VAEAPKFKSALLEAEAMGRQQREAATNALRIEWGELGEEEYSANLRAIDQLPAGRRKEEFERFNDKGVLAMYDPVVLKRLAAEARQAPTWLAEAAKKHGGEKAAIEILMANRASSYWKGRDAERLQARYRDLVREAENKKAAADQAKNDARLEKVIANVRSKAKAKSP
jgi:hypothetical protein